MSLRFLCLFALIVLFGCEGKLPKPTQNGSNVFACKLNKKKWEPNGGPGLFSGLKPITGNFNYLYRGPKDIGIKITANRSDGTSVELFLEDTQPNTYQLNQNTNSFPISIYAKSYGKVTIKSGQRYITSAVNTGQITLTKADTVTKIISGTFFFKAGAVDINGNPNGTGIMTVTEGRFDIKAPL